MWCWMDMQGDESNPAPPRPDPLEAVMNLLRNSLLMRKTGDRRRTELTEIFAFLCGFPAEFITRSRVRFLSKYQSTMPNYVS